MTIFLNCRIHYKCDYDDKSQVLCLLRDNVMRDYVAGLDPYLVNHEVNLNCVPDNAFNGLIKSLVSKYLVTDHFRKKLMPRVDML